MTGKQSEQVPLQVRVTVVVELERGKPIGLDAFTLSVDAGGGLLEMSLKVSKGQTLLLFNPCTGQHESCTVVSVRNARGGGFAVAFEFDRPLTQFWPISFDRKIEAL